MNSSSLNPNYHSSYGLVIGINAYVNYPPLSYAKEDAESFAEILTDELGFPGDNLTILLDEEAKKESILEKYQQVLSLADDPDDRIVVFYAGHGFTTSGIRGPAGFLVPVDGEVSSIGTLIRWDDFPRAAEFTQAKHILFVMDACYSGLMLQKAITPGQTRFVREMLQRKSWQVITAGKADETVADGGGPEGRNSIFTGYLIKGIRGDAQNDDGIITANGLMHYVYQNVGTDDRSNQTPHYGHIYGDGDFILKLPDDTSVESHIPSSLSVETVQEVVPEESLPEVGRVESDYLSDNGYALVRSAEFGRNRWSERLGEIRREDGGDREYSRAYSWLAMVMVPATPLGETVDSVQVLGSLIPDPPELDLPVARFPAPLTLRTSLDSASLSSNLRDTDWLQHYLRLDDVGNLEYGATDSIFWSYRGERLFRYVTLVGMAMQFTLFGATLLENAGITAGYRFLFNLIGTRDTLLHQFAEGFGPTKLKWQQLFEGGSLDIFQNVERLRGTETNIQLEYRMTVGSFETSDAMEIADDIARKLGRAFNLQSEPRCYVHGTTEFPWNQYANSIRWLR